MRRSACADAQRIGALVLIICDLRLSNNTDLTVSVHENEISLSTSECYL